MSNEIDQESPPEKIVRNRRISVQQLAAEQGVDVCTVYRWIRRGVRGIKLSTTTVGGRRVILRAVYEIWQQCITRRMDGGELDRVRRRSRRRRAVKS